MPSKKADYNDNAGFERADSPQMIYADKIVQIYFSPNVIKMDLGVEVEKGKFKQTSTIVLPTMQLLSGMNTLNLIAEDEKAYETIIQYAENVKESLEKLKQNKTK